MTDAKKSKPASKLSQADKAAAARRLEELQSMVADVEFEATAADYLGDYDEYEQVPLQAAAALSYSKIRETVATKAKAAKNAKKTTMETNESVVLKAQPRLH